MIVMRLAVFILALGAAACFNSPTGPDAVVGQPFDLKAGAVSTLPDGAHLRFERVQSDSRCPMDAVCVWAGDAIISVTLKPAKGAAESREMHTQPTGSQISYANYTIKLTALAPYPRSSQEIPATGYIATFVVSVR
jgi:hypothetical protein